MLLPSNYIPVGRVKFEDFCPDTMDLALRSMPERKTGLHNLRILVSQKTYSLYAKSIVARMGLVARMGHKVGIDPSLINPTYAGVPVLEDEEMPDNMLEVYGPAI